MLLRRPLSPEEAALQQRLFQEAIEPIRKMQVYLYSIYMPTLIMDSEGKLLSAAYPEEMQAQVKKLDELIQQMAAQWQRP